MGEPARKRNLYDDFLALPPYVIGEVLEGQLYAHPRPRPSHAVCSSALGGELSGPFQRGRGGPGGWWILDEPELHFVGGEIAVPDLAGWRRERLPTMPDAGHFELVPDWVCEVLSPSTASVDREIKMPLYARQGVAFAWLVDPARRTLEAYQLANGSWQTAGGGQADAVVRVAPFEALELELGALWG